jgi:hypothetical protein
VLSSVLLIWPGARAGYLLTTLAFLAFVVGQSPHLVHHLFEPEEAQAECVYAASSDRVSVVAADVVALSVDLGASADVSIPARPGLVSRSVPPRLGRAPPVRLPA